MAGDSIREIKQERDSECWLYDFLIFIKLPKLWFSQNYEIGCPKGNFYPLCVIIGGPVFIFSALNYRVSKIIIV